MIKVFNFKQIFKNIKFLVIIVVFLFIILFLKNDSSSELFSDNLQLNTFFPLFIDIPISFSTIDNYHIDFNTINGFIFRSDFAFLNSSFFSIPYVDNHISLASENNSVAENTDIVLATGPLSTEIIDSGISNTYTNEYNTVQIKNTSNYELTYDMLNPESLDIHEQNIIIFHTHTCESYTQSDLYQYEESGNFRTTDLERSVVKVGSVLTDYLVNYGFKVIHNTAYHDFPSYNGSYDRSLESVQSDISNLPNTDIIIDIHRDAIADDSYAPSIKIGDETVSQLMFVLGTDGGGLEHPNWINNLKFAVKVQNKANELYPGLFKPIILRNSRYNQHLGNAACIIEVGATGNTLEQSMGSMKYLSYVLNEVLNN